MSSGLSSVAVIARVLVECNALLAAAEYEAEELATELEGKLRAAKEEA